MTSPDPSRPVIATALTTAEAAAVLADPALRGRWSHHRAAFTVLGIDRLPGAPTESVPAAGDLDPSVLATALAVDGGPAVVVAATAHIDLPYNLARRTLSLDHLTRGRSGLLLGSRDPRGRTGNAWSGAGLGAAAELGPATTADTAHAVLGLWQSWPLDSIAGDKESGILVHSERIRRAGHRGVTRTAGPLSIPTSPQGTPVLGWYGTGPDIRAHTPDIADLTVLGGLPDRATVTSAAGQPGRAPVLAEASVRDLETAAELLRAGAHGLLLRTTGPGTPAETAAHLLGTDLAVRFPGAVVPGDTTLRDTLGLPPPRDLLSDATAAFPAPSPGVYR
jgi:alkanesulfonate monooxygenase SsuD/methylene tetrahydromethanopterin reductase-like flavin-dependent oxidoreductase (luciferase family)